MKLTKDAIDLLYEKIDPWMLQTPDNKKHDLFQGMLADIKNGNAFPFFKGNIIFYMIPETKWLFRTHIFGKHNGSFIETYENAEYLTDYLFDRFSDLKKIYGITPHKGMKKVAPKIGWKNEGTLTQSHMKQNGEMIDQYIFAITREENKNFRLK